MKQHITVSVSENLLARIRQKYPESDFTLEEAITAMLWRGVGSVKAPPIEMGDVITAQHA